MKRNKDLNLPDTEACVGCSVHFPPFNGPVHPYMISSPGCWKAYGEILQRFYESSLASSDVHRICVDAYAIQHPGIPSPRAIQSVTGHLINLCLIFEYRINKLEWRRGMIQTVTHFSDQFNWLEPPIQNGLITVADLIPQTDIYELQQLSVKWARSIWDSWHVHHSVIHKWANKIKEHLNLY
jgi:hypothetical protein